MGKNKDKIRISFKDSGAAEDVTGSMTVITYGNPQKTILVDCGLIQGGSLLSEYRANSRKLHFKPKDVDYIIITHGHGDHCLLLPRIYREGCTAPIIMPFGAYALFRDMALDSAKIMARDSIDLMRRYKDKDFPEIYNEDDVHRTLGFIKEYPKGDKIVIDDTLTIEYVESQHVLFGCQVILYIKNGSSTKKIAFTGDLGNISVPRVYTGEFKPIQNSNLLVGECTYASKERSVKAKDRDKDLEKIKAGVADITESGGKMLIPSFFFMRSQVIATVFYNLFHDDPNFNVDVYVASPLTCKICNTFDKELIGEDLEKWEKVRNWDKIKFVNDYDTVEKSLGDGKVSVYISSAGMLNSGFAVGIAEKLLPSAKNILMFVGYSVENSLSWKIKQKKTKTVTINGKSIPSRAKVINLASFSSHMSRDDLIRYYSGGMGTGLYGKICLQHGNFKDRCEFAEDLQKEISKRNRTDKVVVVNKSTEILL